MPKFTWLLTLCLTVTLLSASADAAAPASAPHPEPPPDTPQLSDEDLDDLSMNFAQPDFTLVALPTTLRVPRHKGAFRVTHRFLRPVTQGSFGELLENFFGFDSGALIGLEYRFGVYRGLQVGVHRTSNRDTQLFGQHSIVRQNPDRRVGLDLRLVLEGRNNLREEYSPSLGLILSREVGEGLGLYVQPIWVGNTDPSLDGDRSTLIVGLAARARIRPTVYLVAEAAPRVAGFTPGAAQLSVAVEKRVGGHAFQLNVSNALGTTMAQVARGGTDRETWFIGFNISRKFY